MEFLKPQLSDVIPFGRVKAHWSGPAIENFSGEEAEGRISVECGLFYNWS